MTGSVYCLIKKLLCELAHLMLCILAKMDEEKAIQELDAPIEMGGGISIEGQNPQQGNLQ